MGRTLIKGGKGGKKLPPHIKNMDAITATGTAGLGIAAGLTALWAYANGEDVGESVKNLWDNTKEKIEKIVPQDTSNESKIRVLENYIKTMESLAMKTPDGNKLLKEYKQELENLKNSEMKEPPKEEPPEEKNPYGKLPVSPQGAIAGAITGINNSDNNFIKDTTNDNIEQNIDNSFNDYIAKMEDYQKKQWEREDTAYQRAVEDARKAGINVGALGGNIQPAQSSTTIMSSASSTEFEKIANMIEQEIENNFKGNENEKDRLTQGIQMLLMMALMKK